MKNNFDEARQEQKLTLADANGRFRKMDRDARYCTPRIIGQCKYTMNNRRTRLTRMDSAEISRY